MPWGSGQIVEEASYSGEYHEPTVQLLEYREGPAQGSLSVRFCYYGHDGRFQRGPLMLNEEDVDGLRDALSQAPRIRTLLRRMVGVTLEQTPDEEPPRPS
jgi:hypothetical protein